MKDLPVVDFELFGFIALVWILVELQNTQARIAQLYVEQMRGIEERRGTRWLGKDDEAAMPCNDPWCFATHNEDNTHFRE